PLEQLAGWARVLYWVLEAESGDRSLLELARREQLDPAVAYRLVHRVTGLRWSQVRRAGLAAMLARFRERCRDRFLSPRPRAATPTRPVADAAGPRERLSWARYEPGSVRGHSVHGRGRAHRPLPAAADRDHSRPRTPARRGAFARRPQAVRGDQPGPAVRDLDRCGSRRRVNPGRAGVHRARRASL